MTWNPNREEALGPRKPAQARNDWGKDMAEDERFYFQIRAEEEIKAAQAADHPDAARAHYMMAGYYLDLAHNPEAWATVNKELGGGNTGNPRPRQELSRRLGAKACSRLRRGMTFRLDRFDLDASSRATLAEDLGDGWRHHLRQR